MLYYLSDQVRECYQRAGEHAQRAEAEADPLIRQSFLDTGQAWLKLARCLADIPELESEILMRSVPSSRILKSNFLE
jgi:hypothetical protein